MKVYRPTNNPITRGYIAGHPGYDFAGNGLPDEVRAGKDGTIIERVDQYSSNWSNTGVLTTRDYGNYIKVKHADGTFALFAHLRLGSSFVVGTQVKAGQTIARIGNTGNSTGPHLHAEYRTSANVNTTAEFYTEGGDSSMANMYKGYDLANPESMKVAVDVLVRLQAGEFVDKSKYEALEKEAVELRKRPVSCPPVVNDPIADALLKAVRDAAK